MLRPLLAFGLALGLAAAAPAQERRPSHCIAVAEAAPGLVWRASYTEPVPEFSVRLTYIDHAMFLIQTPGGLAAVTDYVGYLGTEAPVPDVVTMNHAHSTHWTASPDPAIPHVLKGWGDGREPNEHYLDLGEMLVRNVPTDIRSGYFDGGVEKYGNSIFVFEVEGLCIGHLGHLHHEPDERQYAALGRLDVVMAPVDGGLTLDLPAMIRVLKRLKSSVVIPMHWFGRGSLDVFLAGMSEDFEVVRTGETSLEVSLRSLPDRPTVMVLEPGRLDGPRP